jgi:hypothetical protein
VSANRGRCAYELFTAEETGHRSRYVTELYSGLLNRVPEQAGWVFQRSALAAMDAQGDPVTARDALISNFIAAAEFTAVYGRRSDAEFVRIVYRQIVGREATPRELEWQLSMITQPRDQVALVRNSLLTPEVLGRFRRRTVALLIFHALLLREPHPTEVGH